MTHLVCLPLDDRPVNYDYPRELAALAGIEIELPEREALGNPWRPSRHDELVNWLKHAAEQADALLIAVDTLGYGGLIPSRTSTESAEYVLERLSILKDLKAIRPDLVILAYSIILRISRDNSAEEEKAYWAEYGRRMFRLSYLEHKTILNEASPAELEECGSIRKQIPDAVYEDYKKGRARNHQVNRTMLKWLAEGVFDYLILPQDDTADYGWNIAEARLLQAIIRQRELSGNAITYPGADEIGSLLLARYACRRDGFSPQVWPRYSSEASGQVITSYEDRSMQELLKAHLAPLDGSLAGSPAEANLLLFINAPAKKQGVAELQTLITEALDSSPGMSSLPSDPYIQATLAEMTSPQRNVEEFVRAIQAALKSTHSVALADVAYVNGSDLFLIQNLLETGIAPNLSAYAGWNTAGNTLGTVLAQSVLNCIQDRHEFSTARQAAHLAFLFRRYLDDYYYQTCIRTQLAYHELPAMGLPAGMERLPDDKAPKVVAKLKALLTAAADDLNQRFIDAGLAREITIENIHLPWQRLFEVGFDVQVELP